MCDLIWVADEANVFLELVVGGVLRFRVWSADSTFTIWFGLWAELMRFWSWVSVKIPSLERGRSCTILDLRRVLRFRIEAAPSDERRCKKYTQNS